jgi:hypothetical protein
VGNALAYGAAEPRRFGLVRTFFQTKSRRSGTGGLDLPTTVYGPGRVPHVRPSVHGPKTDSSNAFTPIHKDCYFWPQAHPRSASVGRGIGACLRTSSSNLESVLTTNPGCPISRSFFARYGIPLPYPRDFGVCFVLEGQRSMLVAQEYGGDRSHSLPIANPSPPSRALPTYTLRAIHRRGFGSVRLERPPCHRRIKRRWPVPWRTERGESASGCAPER